MTPKQKSVRKGRTRYRRNRELKSVRTVGSNMTEAEHGDLTILYSYKTPVAILGPLGLYKTDTFHSRTTSTHIGKWFRLHGLDGKGAKKIPQAIIDRMAEWGSDIPELDRNPRRKRFHPGAPTRKAQRFISGEIRHLAHKGMRAPRRVAAAYGVARRKGYRSVRVRRNPATSETSAWKSVQAVGAAMARSRLPGYWRADGMELEKLAANMLAQLGRGIHENPGLAIVGANPPRSRMLGYITGDIRYKRTIGEHPGWYKHHFKTRARLLAMPDGSLSIRAS